MKKSLIVLLFSLSFIIGNSQVVIGVGGGYAPKQKAPTAELHIGGIFRNTLLIDVGMQTLISRKQSAATQFQWRMGWQINRNGGVIFTPYAGASFHYISAENKSQNHSKPLFGLEVAKPFKYESGMLYFNASKSGNIYIASIGVKYLFNKERVCY